MNKTLTIAFFFPCAVIIASLAFFGIEAPAGAQSTTRDLGGQPVKYFSAATTNSTLVAAGYRTLTGATVINTTATIYYLKLYDKVTAPTCGTDTPVQVFPIPASSSGNGFVLSSVSGTAFVAGMGFCLTGAIADADTTAAATGVVINLTYK